MALNKLTHLGAIALTPLIMVGCSSSNDNPQTASDSYTINAKGGTGGSDNGSGGTSGIYLEKNFAGINISKRYGTGNIEIRKTGSALDNIEISEPAAVNLGAVPLQITSDLILNPTETEPASGVPYSVNSDLNTIYLSNGDGIIENDEIVTGIAIAPGVTLTLNGFTQTISISLNNDMQNEGIIQSGLSDGVRLSIELEVANYFAGSESAINTQGTGSNPHAGSVSITAGLSVYNLGKINTNGLDSENSSGGNAASISLIALDGNIYNKGALTSRGGNGTRGGHGASMSFNTDATIINAGEINTQGGNGSIDSPGNAGSISMHTSGGQIITAASLKLTGGNTLNAEANGGLGGDISLQSAINHATTGAFGDIKVSGNINISGGNALASGIGDGGHAGAININMENAQDAAGESIQLSGYSSINLSGGDANFPGVANDLKINMNASYDTGTGSHGNIINEANIIATGGNIPEGSTTPGPAGAGGNVVLSVLSGSETVDAQYENIINSGNINISTGSGSNNSASKKIALRAKIIAVNTGLFFHTTNDIKNSGSITANGGDNVSETGNGSSSRMIAMTSENAEVNNTSSITANGGNGGNRGGSSNGIRLTGSTVINSGALSATGGDAISTNIKSIGGNGGIIELASPNGADGTSHSGSVNHAPGSAAIPGTDGSFINGGVLVSGTDFSEF